MPSTLPILRARRERRLAKQHSNEFRRRNGLLSVGMLLSFLGAALIIATAFTYVNLTRDLPSVETEPSWHGAKEHPTASAVTGSTVAERIRLQTRGILAEICTEVSTDGLHHLCKRH